MTFVMTSKGFRGLREARVMQGAQSKLFTDLDSPGCVGYLDETDAAWDCKVNGDGTQWSKQVSK